MIIQSNKPHFSASWYWKDDEANWKAFTSDLNDILESQFKENNFNFDLNIGQKRYKIDLLNKPMKQTNVVSGYVHEISNKVPMVSKYQWSFENDNGQKSPLSEKHSGMIEKAYKSKDKFIDIELRRHNDDNMEMYRYQFSRNDNNSAVNNGKIDTMMKIRMNSRISNSESIGIQINMRTGFRRNIFRDEKIVQAEILEDENTHIESKDILKIFISGIENNANIAISKLKKLIEDAYVTEKYPLIEISEKELKRLEEENSAVIKITSANVILKALPDDLNKIKSELLNVSLQNLAISYPTNWFAMNNERVKIVEILRNSSEFNDILREVSKSVPNPQIKKVERIQNTWLWDKYVKTTKFLESKGTKKNEKWLFHGTGNTGNFFIFF
jgi:hypothetical protein